MNKRNLKKPEIKEVKISEIKRFFLGIKNSNYVGCAVNTIVGS
jgi:hypothetical protein